MWSGPNRTQLDSHLPSLADPSAGSRLCVPPSLPFNVQPQMALLQAGYSLLGDVFSTPPPLPLFVPLVILTLSSSPVTNMMAV